MRADLTQLELARQVGIDETGLIAWEKDRRLPEKTESLVRLSRALDVSIDYLLLGRRPAGIDHLVGGIAELLEEARALQEGSATGEEVSRMEPNDTEGAPEETRPTATPKTKRA